jgi:2-polyprenyl-6-methoxyphenol hydroxylase-like FAD-dependent oxidoreductase
VIAIRLAVDLGHLPSLLALGLHAGAVAAAPVRVLVIDPPPQVGARSVAMMDRLEDVDEVPVLLAGGGLVGLSTAMFLAQHGVASLAVEPLSAGSQLPRAAFFHMRTLELFRAAGIEDEVRLQSLREFEPEGAIVMVQTLAGGEVAGIIPSLNEGVEALSPCRRLFITQPGLEPILRARAERAGARVLEGAAVVGLAQDADGVVATVRDVATGRERQLRAKYLVGADGAHSKVRELLGIEFDGRGVFSSSITIYFHAPMAPLIAGKKPMSVIYVKNPELSGFFRLDKDAGSGFLVVNTVGDTSKPEAANPASNVSEPRLIELVRAGVGVPDLPVTIDGVARWRATSDVARRFCDQRVFLAGDAAHLMLPNGGYGGNTGIHDAHNLAWKLALVLNGVAGPELLSTYDTERRPVAAFTVEQAYTRYVTRSATYLGAKDYQPLAGDPVRRRPRSRPRSSPPVVRATGLARASSLAGAGRAADLDDRSVRPGVRRDRRSRRRGLGRRRPVGRARHRRPRARGPCRRPGRPERSRWTVRGGLRADLVRRSPGAPGRLRRLARGRHGRRSGACAVECADPRPDAVVETGGKQAADRLTAAADSRSVIAIASEPITRF